VRKSRFNDPNKSGGPNRAERRANARRTRALSHLERIRGEIPQRRHRPAGYVATAVIAAAIGTFVGTTLAEGNDWLRREPRVESIAVRGARHLAADEIAQASGVPRNAALAGVEPEDVATRLVEHAWIAAARTLRLPTGTLVVSVTERSPAGRVVGPASDRIHLVDASGTPFAEAGTAEHSELPLVRLSDELAAPESNAAIARALELAKTLPRFGLPESREILISPVDDPAGFTLLLFGVIPRVVLGREDFDPKLRELARLLAAELPEFADASELDLRFAGQGILRNDPLPEGAEQAAVGRGFAPPST
jgi:cell division septal protein FtsQ